ncbi:MAG: sulfatase-like hydrolase/transferase [Myxococcota bacterium]
MSRQTIAVTVGTLALLVIGFILMYGSPNQPPVPAPATNAQQVAKAKAGKAKGKGKSKGPQSKRLGPAKLIHASEIPEDRPKAPAGAPNVVVVVMSTQRRDQWTPYTDTPKEPPVTPFLAEQAQAGALMMDALSVAVDPHPADAAIITGQYPHHVGGIEPTDKKNRNELHDDASTIAERLAEAGWYTVGLSANHNLNAKVGAAQGFDWYRDSQPFSLMLDARIAAPNLVNIALQRVAERTPEQLERPLYLQLAFVDSHKPLKVPPTEFEAYKESGSEIAPYLGTLHRQDEALRTLVTGLAEKGITADNTVFVVVADHGEGLDMPPHHRSQHGFVLYESSVRIPWLWWGKGVAKGKQVEGLASQIDLAPTLVALAGLGKEQGFDGMDLSAAVKAGGKTPHRGLRRHAVQRHAPRLDLDERAPVPEGLRLDQGDRQRRVRGCLLRSEGGSDVHEADRGSSAERGARQDAQRADGLGRRLSAG